MTAITSNSPGILHEIKNFYLGDHLPVNSLAQAAPFFWLSFFASWSICYLVHLPNDTRLLRKALWPIAVGMNLWGVSTVDMRGRQSTLSIVGLFFCNATSAAIRWGLATTPPTYQTLPRQPYFSSFRFSIPIKALNLIIDEPRLISLAGQSSPPLKPSSRSNVYHIIHHLFDFLVAFIAIDIVTYPLYHLDPFNLGHPKTTSANWDVGMTTISIKLGLPKMIVTPIVVLLGILGSYFGMSLVWHPAAILAIVSGIWIPEEWPKVMNKPWMSTSLNELWGKRYHQMLRHLFQNYSRAFNFLSRHLSILRIFFVSAIYHMLVYHPYYRTYDFKRQGLMWFLSGLGLEAERQHRRFTGERVGGWSGRLWTYGWTTFCAWFMLRAVGEMGWLGGIREAFYEDRRTSLVEWGLYFVGNRPHPSLPAP